MEQIIRLEAETGSWEYLGTVVQNGVEFIALQPLDGAGRVGFFLCEGGAYLRVADAEAERVLSRRFRQAAMEEARGRLREAR